MRCIYNFHLDIKGLRFLPSSSLRITIPTLCRAYKNIYHFCELRTKNREIVEKYNNKLRSLFMLVRGSA